MDGNKQRKKNYTVKDAKYWFCNLLYSVMAGTVVWLLFTHLTWPEGWIPSRWSDFGFWKEKVDQAVAEFKLYLMLPKTVSQTEGMILGGKTVCAGGGSCFCICCGKYMKRDMTESLTEEGEGRIFQWSRIKSLWQSSKQLLGYQGSLIAAIPTVHSAYRYLKMSHRIHSYKGSCYTA